MPTKTKKKSTITNGDPKKAAGKIKRGKDIERGVMISPELYNALLMCYGELLMTHRRYGDFENAMNHSAGLNNVVVYITPETMTEMRKISIPCDELTRYLKSKNNAFKFDLNGAIDLLLSENAGGKKFDLFGVLNEKEILNRVKKVYIEYLGYDDPNNEGEEDPLKPINMSSPLDMSKYGEDALDSLDSAELIMAIEEEFDIKCPDAFADMMTTATFADLVATLKGAYKRDYRKVCP